MADLVQDAIKYLIGRRFPMAGLAVREARKLASYGIDPRQGSELRIPSRRSLTIARN